MHNDSEKKQPQRSTQQTNRHTHTNTRSPQNFWDNEQKSLSWGHPDGRINNIRLAWRCPRCFPWWASEWNRLDTNASRCTRACTYGVKICLSLCVVVVVVPKKCHNPLMVLKLCSLPSKRDRSAYSWIICTHSFHVAASSFSLSSSLASLFVALARNATKFYSRSRRWWGKWFGGCGRQGVPKWIAPTCGFIMLKLCMRYMVGQYNTKPILWLPLPA